ncbi:MFS transporter [Paenibacillus cymbidii]|uniref:MFS transporter n=1 Tax=Paenibacillus cymbidii TaxID=1639034 RepID=UPI0010816523|nr:MFS transporter [Paenibacillus cymbidii]
MSTLQNASRIRRLLLMNASSMIIFNYIGIFVNLYIWEKEKSIFDVTWFNLVMFVSWIVAFAIGARILTRYSNRLLIRITAISGGLTFLLLSFLELDNKLLWISIIAIPVGIMWGLYASTQNITLSLYGKGRDFESYFSYSSLIGQAISIANPIVFALVIQWLGYNGSFLLMFLFVATLLTVSFFIPTLTLSEERTPLFENIRFSAVFNTSALRWMVPSCITAGLFIQFQGLFALIFTFSVSSDKLVIAMYNMLYALSSIAAMTMYRRLKVGNGKWLTIGVLLVSVGFLCPVWPVAPLLVISNILTTMGMFYYGTIWNMRQFRIISSRTPIEQARIFIWREWILNLSRIAMLVFTLFVRDLHGTSFFVLIGLAVVSALLVPYFSHKSEVVDGRAATENEVAKGGAV